MQNRYTTTPTIIAAIVIAAWLGGCSASLFSHSKTPSADPDAALLEAGFRYVLADAPKDQPIFIARSNLDGDDEDPPRGLRAKLADLKLDLRPASAAEHRAFQGIFDRKTGQRGVLYFVEIKHRVSDTKVWLDVGHWSGPLAAGDNDILFELKDGHWVPSMFGEIRVS